MAVLLILGIILFVGDEWAKALAVDAFRTEYRVFLGPTFIVVTVISIARILSSLSNIITAKKYERNRNQHLHALTPEEKGYLVPYIRNKKSTVHIGLEDGIMAGLVHKEITYLASNTSIGLGGFAYNLQPWAREYLEKHRNLLDGHIGRPRTPEEKLRREVRNR